MKCPYQGPSLQPLSSSQKAAWCIKIPRNELTGDDIESRGVSGSDAVTAPALCAVVSTPRVGATVDRCASTR
jgi:hypothetical protein